MFSSLFRNEAKDEANYKSDISGICEKPEEQGQTGSSQNTLTIKPNREGFKYCLFYLHQIIIQILLQKNGKAVKLSNLKEKIFRFDFLKDLEK